MNIEMHTKGISFTDRKWEDIKKYFPYMKDIIELNNIDSNYLYTIGIDSLKAVIFEFILHYNTYRMYNQFNGNLESFRQEVMATIENQWSNINRFVNDEKIQKTRRILWSFVFHYFKDIYHLLLLHKNNNILPINKNRHTYEMIYACIFIVYTELLLRKREIEILQSSFGSI